MRIMAVDDEVFILTCIKHLIEKSDKPWTLIGGAQDGYDALEKLGSMEVMPDLMIIDMKMPEMNGIELTREVRLIDPDMLIIILSGFAEFEFAQESIKYGVLEYLLKPIKPDQLITALCRAEQILNMRIERQAKDETFQVELSELRAKHRLVEMPQPGDSDLERRVDNAKHREQILFALQYIEQNYAADISLKHLGSLLYMNPSYFCNIFKKETGMFFSQYLSEIRIKMAKEFLLTRMDLRSYEVANLVGYKDTKYFNYVFKKRVGATPSEFRAQARQD